MTALLTVWLVGCTFDWNALDPRLAAVGGGGGVGGGGTMGGAGGAAGMGGARGTTGTWSNVRRVEALSSIHDDDDPTFTSDGTELYFAQHEAGDGLGEEIFVSERASIDDDWSLPMPQAQLNTSSNESNPVVSSDGLLLLFGSDRIATPMQVYACQRTSRVDAWTTPTIVTELINGQATLPVALSEDKLRLIISRRAVIGASWDFFEYVSDPGGQWALVRELVALNTGAREVGGWLSADALTFMFDSGPGGAERLFRATRASVDTDFSPGEPVVELNDAFSALTDPWVAADGRYMLFVVGDAPDRDIYEATR